MGVALTKGAYRGIVAHNLYEQDMDGRSGSVEQYQLSVRRIKKRELR